MNDTEHRPWGYYTILATLDNGVVVKKLCIKPGQQFSYQSHVRRHEHWTVVEGEGHVTLDDKRVPVAVGAIISVPLGTKHRVTNTHPTDDLVIIEVMRGEYDENDIVRYEDDYGRTV